MFYSSYSVFAKKRLIKRKTKTSRNTVIWTSFCGRNFLCTSLDSYIAKNIQNIA